MSQEYMDEPSAEKIERSYWTASPKFLWKFVKSRHYQWLLSEIEVTREIVNQSLDQEAEKHSSASDQTKPAIKANWKQAALILLSDATMAVKSNERQRAWQTLKAAKRQCLYGMNDEEILTRAILVHEEAGKIDSEWRKKAIRTALNIEGEFPSNKDLSTLFDPKLANDHAALVKEWEKAAVSWNNGPSRRRTTIEALVDATRIVDEHYDNF